MAMDFITKVVAALTAENFLHHQSSPSFWDKVGKEFKTQSS
jgi:hypothetical protein